MNRQFPAEKVWQIPGKIYERLGTLDVKLLANLTETEALHLFREPEPLHRLRKTMAECFLLAMRKIRDDYAGDASNIWAGPVGSGELVRRFKEFKGVGPKIATMAVNILVRDFRIEVADRRRIDVSVDTHVRRVFKRLGLVSSHAADDEIIAVARMMHSEYPGIFDFACWDIGRKWCKANDPLCADCYMEDLCPSAGSV